MNTKISVNTSLVSQQLENIKCPQEVLSLNLSIIAFKSLIASQKIKYERLYLTSGLQKSQFNVIKVYGKEMIPKTTQLP